MNKPCERDWAFLANKHLKLEISQNQNRMELYDEQLPRGGNPLAVVAVLAMVAAVTAMAVMLVLHFADRIDQRPVANIKMVEAR